MSSFSDCTSLIGHATGGAARLRRGVIRNEGRRAFSFLNLRQVGQPEKGQTSADPGSSPDRTGRQNKTKKQKTLVRQR